MAESTPQVSGVPAGTPAFVEAFVADRRKRLELACAELERLGREMDYWRGVQLDCRAWFDAMARQYPQLADVCAQTMPTKE